ncbi:MAG: manganese efflux pump MntP family protein [Polyangiaceae bacterium]
MRVLGVLTLAVGLAMDATAVAAAKSLVQDAQKRSYGLRMALVFGAFQGGMPVIGWGIGSRFASAIGAWAHWVAFLLLAGIGLKMIYEVARNKRTDEEDRAAASPFGWGTLIALAVATSIDALAAGLTLPMLGAPIVVAAAIIGTTTALLSGLGFYVGRRFGAHFGAKLEVFGGILLVGLGLKLLFEHYPR